MWQFDPLEVHRLALYSWVSDEGLGRVRGNCTQSKLKLIWTMACHRKLENTTHYLYFGTLALQLVGQIG